MEDTDDEDETPRKKARSINKKKLDNDDNDNIITKRVDVDFKKLQIIPMGIARVIKEPWLKVLDEVVTRMSHISILTSRFLNFYISRIFSTDKNMLALPMPPSDKIFQKEFFEHIFKAVTHDTIITFEPTLQFVRCVWLHALLVSPEGGKVTDLDPLDEKQLWEEVQSQECTKQDKKKAGKKRLWDDDDDDVDRENVVNIKKSKSLSGAIIIKSNNISLVHSILKHPVLANLLPSCLQIDQCIKYESITYQTAFVQYQSSGLRAHFGWLLLAKYHLSKKDVRVWLENNFPKTLIDQEDSSEFETVGDINMESDFENIEMDIDDNDTGGLNVLTSVNGDGRLIFSDSESKIQEKRLIECLSILKPHDQLLQVVRLHHSILQELVSINAAHNSTKNPLTTQDTQDAKQFALAPICKWSRRFIRFDTRALNMLLKHQIYTKQSSAQNKGNKIVIESTSEIFKAKEIHLSAKGKRNITLAPTFTTDGVQLHLAWQKIVKISCPSNSKNQAIYEAKPKEKINTPKKTVNGKTDGRTLKKKIPILSSEETRYWKKTDRLEDHDYGIFQTSSILASREHAQQKERPLSISDLPFKHIKAIDPGHTNVICTANWNHMRQDWEKGFNLTKKTFYREQGQQHKRRRTENRMKYEALGQKVASHMDHLSKHSPKTSDPTECLKHLLYVSSCWDDMFAFYGSRNAARDRFRSMQKKQRLIANIIEKLAPESEKKDTIIVLGDATFATSMKGTQATPIGRIIKELAKVRRIVLVGEYFTTQMCSGCNLSGIGNRHSKMYTKSSSTSSIPSHSYSLRSTSNLIFRSFKMSIKAHHVNHPTCSMSSFRRTVEPTAMRKKRICRTHLENKRHNINKNDPPDPGDPGPSRRKFDPLSAPIHGLKQCTHCGRFWNRDFSAARNIGWVFIGLWISGDRPMHLRRFSKQIPTISLSSEKNSFSHFFSSRPVNLSAQKSCT